MINTYNYFVYHPVSIILLAAFVLLFIRKSIVICNIIIIITMIISGYILYYLPTENTFRLFGIAVSYSGSIPNKIISIAFLIALFAANINSIANNRYYEMICGSLYGACTITCVLAADFISMFVALELMVVFATIIIFMGGRKESFLSAKKYFITHLLSSNMILITIIHIFLISQSFEIIQIGEIFRQTQYSITILLIGLSGLLINVAIFPFSGWMINYYPTATSSGFVYLISFTTKLSIMLIFKLFAGCELLKYAGIIMIIYASIKVIIEKDNMRILCYFSIISMGVMLIAFSTSNSELHDFAIYYLFISILAILVMSLACSLLINATKTSLISISGFITGLVALLAVPGTFSFTLKDMISRYFESDRLVLWLMSFSIFIIGFAFPWKKLFYEKKLSISDYNINFSAQLMIVVICLITILCLVFGGRMLGIASTLYNGNSLKQIIIILSSIFLAFVVRYRRFITKPISLLELLGNIIFSLHKYKTKINLASSEETILLSNIGLQCRKFFGEFHNQQTAIAVIFMLLTALLFTLMILF